jgi:hypothetical protein
MMAMMKGTATTFCTHILDNILSPRERATRASGRREEEEEEEKQEEEKMCLIIIIISSSFRLLVQ